ncbi:hypothetical protein ABEX25_07015 [Paenibacillus thiaminolyticus]|uniref:hypothetical protein n=1 Tax=Paenibacillus thiaminolyticus TaxID=49283 RepID=UPI003D27D2B8
MSHKPTLIYGIMNTTIFISYFLFIAMGDHESATLGGWLPLLLFYSFKYIGTYLLNILGTRTQSLHPAPAAVRARMIQRHFGAALPAALLICFHGLRELPSYKVEVQTGITATVLPR